MTERTFQSHILSTTDSSIPITITEIRLQISGDYPLMVTEDNEIYVDKDKLDEQVVESSMIETPKLEKRVRTVDELIKTHPRSLEIQTSDSGIYVKTDIDIQLIYTIESPEFIEPIYLSKPILNLSRLKYDCFSPSSSSSTLWSLEERLQPLFEFSECSAHLYVDTNRSTPHGYIGEDTKLLTIKQQNKVSQSLSNIFTGSLALLSLLATAYMYIWSQNVFVPTLVATGVLSIIWFSGAHLAPKLSGEVLLTDPIDGNQEESIVFSSQRDSDTNVENVVVSETTTGTIELQSVTTDQSWKITTTDSSEILSDETLDVLYDIGFENLEGEEPVTVTISPEKPENKPAIELETSLTESSVWIHSANK